MFVRRLNENFHLDPWRDDMLEHSGRTFNRDGYDLELCNEDF